MTYLINTPEGEAFISRFLSYTLVNTQGEKFALSFQRSHFKDRWTIWDSHGFSYVVLSLTTTATGIDLELREVDHHFKMQFVTAIEEIEHSIPKLLRDE